MLEVAFSLIGAALLGIVGWAYSLGNRVAVLEADKISLKELIEAKLETILVEQRNQSARLERIEDKLDTEGR